MTNEQREAPQRNKHGCCADKACTDATCMELPTGKTCGHCVHERLDMWERFAELVAAAEREACAQIVQSECIGFTPEDDQLNCIVAAIRARSIQPPKGED